MPLSSQSQGINIFSSMETVEEPSDRKIILEKFESGSNINISGNMKAEILYWILTHDPVFKLYIVLYMLSFILFFLGLWDYFLYQLVIFLLIIIPLVGKVKHILLNWKLKKIKMNIDEVSGKKLLILRTYGSEWNTKFLFDGIARKWRNIGPVMTIADGMLIRNDVTKNFIPRIKRLWLAIFVILFINGIIISIIFQNVRQISLIIYVLLTVLPIVSIILIIYPVVNSLFTKTRTELVIKLNKKSNFKSKIDSKYRELFFFCFENIWKTTLDLFIQNADVVLMDLRGYSSKHRGCTYEIGRLIQNYNLEKIIIIVNMISDLDLINQTINSEWTRLTNLSSSEVTTYPKIYVYYSKQYTKKQDCDNILRLLVEKLTRN